MAGAGAGVVTLLFTDLVGSTELLSALGDDRAEDLRRMHFRLLRQAVADAGGQEVKNLGDGLMVVFASAADAVACAARMQRAVDRHNRRHPEGALLVRMGVHVGEPIRDEDDYFGTAVVVAKRLCDRAEGGQILASELVRGLAEPRCEIQFRPLGPLTLKGLAQPVPACEVLWQPDDEPPALPPAFAAITSGPRLVGRRPELGRLRQAWEHARDGSRQLVLLAGEPGIGKTRLAVEFTTECHQAGAVVIYGRCDEDALVPYQPFVEALRHWVVTAPADQLTAHAGDLASEVARLVPELGERLGRLPEPLAGEHETQRYRLFEGVASLVRSLSDVGPVVLLLDDLHWADKPTLLMMRHLIRSSEPTALLVLGTYRDSELGQGHPLSDMLADLRREHRYERAVLKGLPEADVLVLVDAWAGAEAPPALAHALYEQTEGNPFFMGEVLRHLAETGVVQPSGGGWLAGDLDEAGIPEGVREVIGRRLARLSDEANRVLVVASAVGREFGLDVLEHLDEVPSERVLDAVEEALAAGLVSELPGGPGRYSFAHTLTRDTLYRQLSTLRRVRLHKRIGEALEQLYGPRKDDHLPELARHFLEAARGGDTQRAVGWSKRAGDRAMLLLAYEEAANHYEGALQALELDEVLDHERMTELLLALGEAQAAAGDRAKARETFTAAAELARARGDAERMARAALGFGGDVEGLDTRGVDQPLVGLLEDALQRLPASDGVLRARVMGRLAVALYWSGSDTRRISLGREAVQMAQRLGDPAALVAELGSTFAGLRDVEERLSAATAILRLAERSHDRERILQAQRWRIMALLELGDVAAADEAIAIHDRVSDELGRPLHREYTAMFLAMRALMEGRFGEGEELAAKALEIGGGIDNPNASGFFGAQMFPVWWHRGELAAVESVVRKFNQEAPYSRMHTTHCAAALIYVEVGRDDEARAEVDALARQRFADLPRDMAWLGGMSLLVEVCADLGDTARSELLHELLLPYAGRTVVVGPPPIACWGPVDHALGRACQALGRLEEAERFYREALAMNERMGARPWLARTQYEYARLLTAGGRQGEAAALLTDAQETGRQLGMAPLVEKSEAMLTPSASAES